MEKWLYIPGTDQRYAVSDQGRVWSYLSNKLLRPGRMSSGHLSVALGRNNSRCVHELVLTTFRGPAPTGQEGRRLNGSHTDNRLTNLEWATRGENIQDKKWHAGRKNYKLKPDDVRVIRNLIARGFIKTRIAKQFNVCKGTIYQIAHGETHRDV